MSGLQPSGLGRSGDFGPLSTEQHSINTVSNEGSVTGSELQTLLEGLGKNETLVTSGPINCDSLTSPVVLNQGKISWFHYGNISFDGTDFIHIGTDGSVPSLGRIHVYGRIYGGSTSDTDAGETLLRFESSNNWDIYCDEPMRANTVVEMETSQSGAVVAATTIRLQRSFNNFETFWHIIGENTVSDLIEGNFVVASGTVRGDSGPTIRHDAGAWNSFLGQTHGTGSQPAIDDKDSRGGNGFVVPGFMIEESWLHPMSDLWHPKSNHQALDYHTQFEGTAGVETDTSGGGTINVSFNRVTLSSSATAGNSARIRRGNLNSMRELTFDKPTTLRTRINFRDTAGPMYAVKGNVAAGNMANLPHIGFVMEGGSLKGTVADGSGDQSKATLRSTASTGDIELLCRLYPGEAAYFWAGGAQTTPDGSGPTATITTNLPAGSNTFAYGLLAVSDGNDRQLRVSDLQVKQAGMK